LMRGYTGGGPLHVDGYRVYDALGDPKQTVSPWVLAYCWVHWRRRFVDFQRATESPLCEEILERIAALYRIEAMVRGHPPELRLKARQELSAPIVEAMRPWLEAQLDRLSRRPNSPATSSTTTPPRTWTLRPGECWTLR